MKKIISKIIGVSLACVLVCVPVIAKSNLELVIDGSKVPTSPSTYIGQSGETPSSFYMEIPPVSKNGYTYIPIRTVATLLGASIQFTSSTMTMGYQENTLTLTLGQKTARLNGEEITLDTPPIVKEHRILVPLRAISEAFGLEIGYANQIVSIETSSPVVENRPLAIVRKEYWMTNGSHSLESTTNLCINRIYNQIKNNTKEMILPPEYFGQYVNLDVEASYLQLANYSFQDRDGNSVKQYGIYLKYNYGKETNEFFLRDVQTDTWFRLDTTYWVLQDLQTLGTWREFVDPKR